MSEKTKPRYDVKSPAAQARREEITNGTFTQEGTLVAFPTCLPGATIPITADESRITALDCAADGIVYGGTSGRAVHLFAGLFHGVTGAVLDMGTVGDADECVGIGCGKTKLAACVNGPGGGRVVTTPLETRGYDFIQEWGYTRKPIQDHGAVNGERILHAVGTGERTSLVGITPGKLFTTDIEEGKTKLVGDVTGQGKIAISSQGGLFGQDGPDHLWRYDPYSKKIERHAVKLPAGEWNQSPRQWARGRESGLLYTADGNGTLFSFDEARGFSSALGRTPLSPVGPMAVTHDGRVFGFCGEEMANMFCYNPTLGTVKNLGVAISVIERRRYGYAFGAAVTGRDGQVIFGEDDNLGHVWLYFPSIQPAKNFAARGP
jgi:hypothetical protein